MLEFREVRLAKPLGARSCGDGGRWEQCHSVPTWRAQLAAVQSICDTPDDFRLLKAELRRLLRAAKRGDLEYGKAADVYKMQSADLVLELRFRQRIEYPAGTRAVRLYFSEPDHEPDVMLAVSLAAKPASEEGLDLQNEHIAEAQTRLQDHYGSTLP